MMQCGGIGLIKRLRRNRSGGLVDIPATISCHRKKRRSHCIRGAVPIYMTPPMRHTGRPRPAVKQRQLPFNGTGSRNSASRLKSNSDTVQHHVPICYPLGPNLAPPGHHVVPTWSPTSESHVGTSTMRTAWGPRDDHVGTTWGPCGDHVRDGEGDHVGTTWRPRG